ncbi:DUF3726 domain-containing protein [Jannaschia sp. W003]|uniref:DUF3726 domain-containing protein n=1 Tax=Jannaschia sp. W003 TaxID=2867012 RepID=UPI0021A5876D|nr:DUF3726 domain-containing protein [Jannaschia sp. W003]UWQ21492.1 DUF3726 domain-containing protein [Jannaschia sp. W003]
MSRSMGETAALAVRATRGAGRSWGLAEEAGRAVRWLSAHGRDGVGALRRNLEGRNCALITGCALADGARDLGRDGVWFDGIEIELLLPFAADAALARGGTVSVDWEGGHATTDGDVLCMEGAAPGRGKVHVRPGGSVGPAGPRLFRVEPDPCDWAALEDLAARTYAPATEGSRAGAGAGTRDDD